jgi:gamma-glutamylcyclotransferase (GGCT)/AIG2-like uncharacterized protein YtfP
MATVFVYGTLKRCHSNNRLLAGAQFVGEAVSTRAEFAMLNGGFPRLTDGVKEGHPVFGEVFTVNRRTLAKLDRLEGHPRWYRRKRRMFRLASGRTVRAWVYIMPASQMPPGQRTAAYGWMAPERGALAWGHPSQLQLERAEEELVDE